MKLLVVDDDLGADEARGEKERERLFAVIGHHSGISFCSAFDSFLGRYDFGPVREAVEREQPQVILLDIGFGDQPYFGFELLEPLAEAFPYLPIVMFTALDRETNLDTALAKGAVDFLNKSTIDDDFFWFTILRYAGPEPAHWVVGQHSEFQQAVYFGAHLASEGPSLLIQGETGSGKEKLVSYVLDVADFQRGAETAANALVLHDVDRLDASDQLATLREVTAAREGGRLILATSSIPVIGLVKRGIFRRDLFDAISSYRSAGTSVVQLPPIRERSSDVPLVLRQSILQQAFTQDVPVPSDVPRQLVAGLFGNGAQLQFEQIEALASRWVEQQVYPQGVAAEPAEIPPSSETAESAADEQPSRTQFSDVDAFLRRVASHDEAYCVEVAGMDIMVLPGVFSPRYSHSSDFLIGHMPQCEDARVLDMGCGTGVLGLAALHLGGAAHATFIDVNSTAIENAQLNLARMGLGHRGRAMTSDVFERVEGCFDLILSNPPFWDRKPQNMLERSCFDEDHRFLRTLIREGRSHLSLGGQMALVLSDQGDIALLFRELAEAGWAVLKVEMQPAFADGRHHVRIVCVAGG